RCAEQHLHVKRDVAGFVIPLGATINMDGTALYEAIAALFIANLVGVELSVMQQMIVFVTAMLAAMGAPGIPSAGMVTMVMVLQSVGLPAEAIAILLPIDRILDTFRTMVNVEGDLMGSLVVQHWIKRGGSNT
ncbi:MAG: dicarboxylate/amino acid:cation symporter, partial [Nitrosomonas sp.]|nr:dicarboxylate/amino acid:cation symporter [Nitrosomonas sp.]